MTYLFLIFLRISNLIPNINEFKIFNLKEKYINFIIIIYCFSVPATTLVGDCIDAPLRLINRIKEIIFTLNI